MAQPQLLGGEILVARARDGNRGRRGGSDDRERARANFDVARRELGIPHRFGTRDDFALDEHDRLGRQAPPRRRRRRPHSASGRTRPERFPRDRAGRRTRVRRGRGCGAPSRRGERAGPTSRGAKRSAEVRAMGCCEMFVGHRRESRRSSRRIDVASRGRARRRLGYRHDASSTRVGGVAARPRRPDRAGREADSASSSGSFQSSQCTRRGPATVVILLDPPRAVR